MYQTQYPRDHAHDIRVKMNDHMDWVAAPPDWAAAYLHYKSAPAYGPEMPVHYTDTVTNERFTVFRVDNDRYMPTRIQRTDTQDTYPIIDCADVKVFLQDSIAATNWYPARDYQMWAYRDFIYDPARPVRKFYASKYSSHLFFQRGSAHHSVVSIDIDGLSPNIIFSISRNENNSVYYERNDANRTRVRICDHEGARAGFRGFYARLTMDPGIIVTPPQPTTQMPASSSSTGILQLPPDLIACKTNNEDDQCIMCYENKKNIEFTPCAHFVACDACYVKFEKPNECPICKTQIVSLIGRE